MSASEEVGSNLFLHPEPSKGFFACFICMCGHRRLVCTPGSGHNSTSGRYSGTSLSVSQSSCCAHGHSTKGRSRQSHETWHYRSCHGSQKNPSQGWAHKSSVSSRSKPGPSLLEPWRSCIWAWGSPPSHGILGVSPPPFQKRCRTCPWGSHRWPWSLAETTSRSSLHSCPRGHDICTWDAWVQ